MIIAIGGLTGSGKNTVGELVAKKLGYRLVCPTFKDLAKRGGITLMEFQKKAENDPDIDKKFDAELREQAKGNCVVTTWLGPWMVEADLRIWVFVPLDIRAQRVADRDGITLEEAKKHILARDESNRQRYLKLYNIDIYNQDIFDVCINNGKMTPEEAVKMVLVMIKAMGTKKGAKIKRKK